MHWHAFAFTGYERPSDGQARDPRVAVMPNELSMWFRKPASMREGVLRSPEEGTAWLRETLAPHPVTPTGLPIDVYLRGADGALRRGTDAYVGYYTAHGRLVVRAVLACPRAGEACPEPATP